MKQVMCIFITDMKKIIKNPIALFVAGGIMILPSLYAWFNIAANWDPYGSTGGLKVAVASLDEGTSIGEAGIQVNVGNMILSNLRANEQIGWQFVDQEKAMEGVKDGSYYACVIIPADFSVKISSILTTEIEKPSIEYFVNEKKNAIATKITDKGVSAIQQQINETLISTASEVLGEVFNLSSKEINEKKEKLVDGFLVSMDNAKNDLDSLASSVSALRSTLLAVDDLIDGIRSNLPDAGLLVADGQALNVKTQGLIDSARTMSDSVADSLQAVVDILDGEAESLNDSMEQAIRIWGQGGNQVLESMDAMQVKVEHIAEVNQQLYAALNRISDKLPIKLPTLTELLNKLDDSLDKQQSLVQKISEFRRSFREAGEIPVNAKEELQFCITEIKNANKAVADQYRNDTKWSLRESSDQAYKALSSATDTLAKAGALIPSIDTTLASTASSFGHMAETLENTEQVIGRAVNKINKTTDSVLLVSDNEKLEKLLEILQNDPGAMGDFLSAPVGLNVNKVYPIDNYGSAMTPFYTILAIWVGGLVLVAVLKCKVKSDGLGYDAKPGEAYFGRYLIFMLFGIAQALIVAFGDLYLLKIQCHNKGLFVLAAVTASIVFTNIIYTLTITFGDVGKAVAVVLLVVQVAGAGGTFPIEVTPRFFQAVNPLLPFTHGINAMRECVAGIYKDAYTYDMLKVLAYLPVSLFVGTVLRKPLLKLNTFFEEKLEETGVM